MTYTYIISLTLPIIYLIYKYYKIKTFLNKEIDSKELFALLENK